jgi:hypothetical protein
MQHSAIEKLIVDEVLPEFPDEPDQSLPEDSDSDRDEPCNLSPETASALVVIPVPRDSLRTPRARMC